jgi:hypothetical protein
MGKLFISHSSKGRVIADALAGRAKALSYDCFLDFQGNLRCPPERGRADLRDSSRVT